ncbi:MAG: type II toxin-antitoxin system PemK/MazF family toxin [Acidobacteriia bacterium]|nr:type II toxin-antitoxin system PemK/MazF family toxin [Terriglobia bacterium]
MPTNPGFRRGDLVVAVFGRDHGKPRPAVVIQSDLFNDSHASAVLCPISSDLTGFTVFRVKVLASRASGLRADSEVMVDRMATVDRGRIRQRIGRLSGSQMDQVSASLRIWLDLPVTV